MDDSVGAGNSSFHHADQKIGSKLPATSVTTGMADSVDDSFSRDQADHQTDPELPSTRMTSAQSHG
jgi:hypothetical protein